MIVNVCLSARGKIYQDYCIPGQCCISDSANGSTFVQSLLREGETMSIAEEAVRGDESKFQVLLFHLRYVAENICHTLYSGARRGSNLEMQAGWFFFSRIF